MIFLESLRIRGREQFDEQFPFTLPLVRQLEEVRFDAPVTFFVGENGAGKSTVLEAIAAAVGSVVVGGAPVESDPSLEAARRLAGHFTLAWRKRTRRGFFMRAEDFVNFGRHILQLQHELTQMEEGFERDLTGYGRQLARGTVRGQREALRKRYGADPDARSHGESFFHVYQERFVPEGLYLLDEPDTALSPQRQIALLALLKDQVAQDAQFIIATHSPIVLAYPGATILSFDGGAIQETAYDELEGVILSRGFLANPDAFLRHL